MADSEVIITLPLFGGLAIRLTFAGQFQSPVAAERPTTIRFHPRQRAAARLRQP